MSEFELYHIDDRGQKVDLSDEQKELADKAKDRCAEKIKKDPEMTEDEYMAELYSKEPSPVCPHSKTSYKTFLLADCPIHHTN